VSYDRHWGSQGGKKADQEVAGGVFGREDRWARSLGQDEAGCAEGMAARRLHRAPEQIETDRAVVV
jgi:hypothetical protein